MDQYKQDASYKKRRYLGNKRLIPFAVVCVAIVLTLCLSAWLLLKMNELQVQNIEMGRRIDDLSDALKTQADHQILVEAQHKRELDNLSLQVLVLNETLKSKSDHLMRVEANCKQKGRLDTQVRVLNETLKSQSDHLTLVEAKQKGRLDKLAKQVRVLNKSQSDHLIHVETTLGKQLTEDEATLRNCSSYLGDLTRNLTQLRSEYAASVVQKQEKMKFNEKSSEKLNEHLEDLKRTVEHLDSEIHQPVDIYKDCITSEDSCAAGTEGNGRYWKACHTRSFPKEKVGYLTIRQGCVYKSSVTDYSETLTVFEKDGEVRCDCDVTYPGFNSAEHRKVGAIGGGTCTITIVQCPTSTRLFDS